MVNVIPAAPVQAFPVVIAGSTGAAGPTGPGGPAGGPTGATGATGAGAFTGPTGATGQPGAGGTGPTGPTGLPGVGSTGPTGAGAFTGPTGAAGSAGTPGAPGSVGATGPTGPPGSAGTSGTPGGAGATGPTGAQGSAGTPGTPGGVGATGPTGLQGTAGTPGGAGATGPTGTAGSVGGAGATGPTGPMTVGDVRYDIAQTLTAPQQTQARQNISAPLRGQLAGLTLSTAGSSATFGIAVGEAADSTAAVLMQLASAYTKTTAAWAVGSGNGSFDGTGSAPTTTTPNWYHVHLIRRADTGVVDVLVSLSATAPTLPANYTQFRRIGAMKTNASSQWIAFIQIGDQFLWSAPVGDVNAGSPGTSLLNYGLTVPFGINVIATFHGVYTNTTAAMQTILFYSPLTGAQTPGTPSGNASFYNPAANQYAAADFQILTNASTQVSVICGTAAGNQLFIVTTGWIDRRGRDA